MEIADIKKHPKDLSVADILIRSSNVGSTKLAKKIGQEKYRKFFEKDRALARRFQKIDVVEPSTEDSIKILNGLKQYFEEHHKIKYS